MVGIFRCLSTTLVLSLYLLHTASAQLISGRVVSAETNEPLVFANVWFENTKIGTTTDLEGYFTVKMPTDFDGYLLVSYIGFNTYRFNIHNLKNELHIKLSPKLDELDEVVFYARENPAYQIVRNAIASKKDNDPQRLPSYQYDSYNKFWVTMKPNIDIDSLINEVQNTDSLEFTRQDSLYMSMDSLIKRQHLFLSESATRKKYKRPGKSYEEVLANEVSGFKSPLFVSLATDFQPFTFYDDIISLLSKDYINPIAPGTFSKYEFYIQDTTFYQNDSVFVISYEPKKSSFNGLKGEVAIVKGDAAILYVKASSADPTQKIDISILQRYGKVAGVWFPNQLHTDLELSNMEIDGAIMKIIQRSYISNIDINPTLDAKSFSDITLSVDGNENINGFRLMKLDSLERNTYVIIDSVSKKLRFSLIENVMEALITQRIPKGSLDIELDRLLSFNDFEGVRVGIGLVTSPRFSKYVEVGGYGAYGFKDNQWKYGCRLNLYFDKSKDFSAQFSYQNDVAETGKFTSFEKVKPIDKETLRDFSSDRFDFIERYKLLAGGRLAQGIDLFVGLQHENINPQFAYTFSSETLSLTDFSITEVSAKLNLVSGLKFMDFLGYKVTTDYQLPIASFRVSKVLDFESDFDYVKYDFFIKHEVKSVRSGTFGVNLLAGVVKEEAPLAKLYFLRGADRTNFYIADHFQTMGYYEFAADEFASVFLTWTPFWTLFNTKRSKPNLTFHQNMAVASMDNPENHQLVEFRTAEEGYFESGLTINNILRTNYADIGYLGLGIGGFYRYGAYAFTKEANNFSWRINIDFSF